MDKHTKTGWRIKNRRVTGHGYWCSICKKKIKGYNKIEAHKIKHDKQELKKKVSHNLSYAKGDKNE